MDHVLRRGRVAVKLRGDVEGLFMRWVRYDSATLRVIAEQDGHVLLIAHPALGHTLGFAELRPMGNVVSVSCRFVPASVVDAARRE